MQLADRHEIAQKMALYNSAWDEGRPQELVILPAPAHRAAQGVGEHRQAAE